MPCFFSKIHYNMVMRGKQLYLFGSDKNNDRISGRPKVILPLDTLLLLGVIVILLFTILFSLGVERGKKIALRLRGKGENIEKQSQAIDSTTAKNENLKQDNLAPQKIVEKEKEIRQEYHVQVASFLKEKSAREEAKSLKDNGYPVAIMKKGNYIVIYVGGFKDKREAKSNIKDLQRRYKDCFLKRL